MLVGLVACCGLKATTVTTAAALYQSQLFKGSVAFVQRRTPVWAILSAKLGLVDPSAIVAPYDLTLAGMGAAERERWGRIVRAQIEKRWPSATFLVLAGELYRAPLKGLGLVVPMAGMGIGKQLQHLANDKGPTP